MRALCAKTSPPAPSPKKTTRLTVAQLFVALQDRCENDDQVVRAATAILAQNDLLAPEAR